VTGAMLPGFLGNFLAFPNFNGTVNIAISDVNGDTFGDVIAVANGANGHVKAFSGADGSPVASFLAFESFLAFQNFAGGVSVAVGDVNGDGLADILTATAAPTAGHVKGFSNGTTNLLVSFLAFDNNFTGGASVSVTDINRDGLYDIAATPGPGRASVVMAFSGITGAELGRFDAFPFSIAGATVSGIRF
jgi:trimeric autotransporter adhesin